MPYNNFKEFCYSITKIKDDNKKKIKISEIETDERLTFLYENYKTPELIQFLWHIYNNNFEVVRCEFCGKPVKILSKSYMNITQNKIYNNICDGCTHLKRKRTNIDKYGVDNAAKSEVVIKKIKETSIKKYGCDYPSKSKIVREKIANTCLNKYGVDSPLKCQNIQDKISNTLDERYGVSNPGQITGHYDKCRKTNFRKFGVETPLHSKEIKKLATTTTLLKYGVCNVFSNKDIKEKIKNTSLLKYGVDNFSKSDEYKSIIYNNKLSSLIKNLKNIGYEFIKIEEDELTLRCDKCNKEFTANRSFLNQRKYFGQDLCTHCNPYRTYSQSEMKLLKFIRLYDFTFETSDREILQGKEIDIYIPSLKIGFEFNGIFWHSDKFKSKYYHQDKKFNAIKQGVNLIHIWEDDWEIKREIIEARIKNILGVTDNKIFSRKCTIIEVSPSDSKAFLEQNHIQGHLGAKHRLGLEYEGNLVSLMTFGMRNGKMEMLRFCNKLNHSVVGGFSKLLKHFRKEFTGEIHSYADLDWSNPNDNVYLKNGFTFVKKTEPGYFWVKNDKRYARQQFQKHKLVAQGFDASKTEDQIMTERGYLKIYNSGNLLYVI